MQMNKPQSAYIFPVINTTFTFHVAFYTLAPKEKGYTVFPFCVSVRNKNLSYFILQLFIVGTWNFNTLFVLASHTRYIFILIGHPIPVKWRLFLANKIVKYFSATIQWLCLFSISTCKQKFFYWKNNLPCTW